MDPAFRERAPRIIIDTDGKERLLVEGPGARQPRRASASSGASAPGRAVVADATMKYVEGRPGGFDPHARIPDMDLDGIDAAFLYPSVGLFAGAIQEPGLAAAMCRAYNRWLADYCRPYPDRLFGVAMLPMQSIDLAIEEMRYARKELGMRAGFLRPNPYNGRMLHHPDYAPFWSEVQELDIAIGLHEGASGGMPQVGVDRFEDARGAAHHLAHHGDDARRDERDLGRRVRALPARAHRLPGVGRRVDRAVARPDGPALRRPGLQRLGPQHAARASCSSATAGSRSSRSRAASSVLADYIGPHKILWATDYPHPDGFFPGAPQLIARPAGAVGGDQARDPRRRRHGASTD